MRAFIAVLVVAFLIASCTETVQFPSSPGGNGSKPTANATIARTACPDGATFGAAGDCIAVQPAAPDDQEGQNRRTGTAGQDTDGNSSPPPPPPPPPPPDDQSSSDQPASDQTTDQTTLSNDQEHNPPITPPVGSLFPGLSITAPTQFTLADFPKPFMTDEGRNYVLIWSTGSAGAGCQINIAGALDSLRATKYMEEELPTSWDEIKGNNLVIVGNACMNRLTKEILGNPDPCDVGLEAGKGYVKLVLYDSEHYAFLIMGKTSSDVLAACKMLGAGTVSIHGTEDSFDAPN